MNKKLQVIKYVLADIVSAAAAWSLFFMFRKVFIEGKGQGTDAFSLLDKNLAAGLLIIPLFWVFLYFITGTYKDIYRKSRLRELSQTAFISLIGSLILFFALILDDEITSYKAYYQSFLTLLLLHFSITFLLRFILTSITTYRIHFRKMGFNTLIVGSNQRAHKLYHELEGQAKSAGNIFKGFVHVEGNNDHLLLPHLPNLGNIDKLSEMVQKNDIEEVIIAIESSEHKSIAKILNELEDSEVVIKIIPDMYDILSGSVKMNSIFSAALIQISHDIMPYWQMVTKRAIDVFVSVCFLILFSPLYLITAILVKLGSKGPVFYSHYRVGHHGKPFRIFKFRSMYLDSEKDGPKLSSSHDSRITPFGKWMRKVRLDEIPQFYNVLIGDMSLVGPRPERQHFIDLIVKTAPHYKHLHKVKPGITSWGQVKYGYAENVEQMIERLKYDVIYIENMSLAVDFKILIYTVLTIIQGRGK